MPGLALENIGAILYIYSAQIGLEIPTTTDDLFPIIAFQHLGPIAGLVFLIGLISAAYPSADGALTALTTSFCVDFLNIKKRTELTEKKQKNIRYLVHIGFAIVLLGVIVAFKQINNQAIISKLFTVAGYTYGPLLGLYAFGLFTKINLRDKFVTLVCLLSPIICFILNEYSVELFYGYKFGFELLIVNGLITFGGLLLLRKRTQVR